MDEQNNNKIPDQVGDDKRKPFYKKWYFWVGLILVIGVALFTFAAAKGKKNDEERAKGQKQAKEESSGPKGFEWPSKTAKYITSLPVDLTQIQSISKYRSCAGHIRDGYNFDQQLELDRSMKHYLFPVPQYQNTDNKVKLFAPFDGTVIKLDWEKDKPDYGRKNAGNGIHLSTSVDPNIDFVIGHIYFTKEYKVGDNVKAGELLGYAAIKCDSAAPGCDFDLDLSTPGGTSAYEGREVLGSIFDHMTDSVLSEFANYGITPDNSKFSTEYRDANLCGFGTETEGAQKSKEEAAKDADGHHNDNHIQLKH